LVAEATYLRLRLRFAVLGCGFVFGGIPETAVAGDGDATD
jgi:hypothetical protein